MTGAVVLGAGIAVLVLAAAWPGSRASTRAASSSVDPVLSAGERVDGLRLTAVTGAGRSGDTISFVYGDCAPVDDVGCAPPAEVQVWPACRRHLGLYRDHAVDSGVDRTTLRGVPALAFDGGRRLELQTGRSTVVVFADTPGRATRIVAALSAAGAKVAPGEPLAPPVPRSLEGVVDC